MGVFKVGIAKGNARNTVSLNERRTLEQNTIQVSSSRPQCQGRNKTVLLMAKKPKRTCVTTHNHAPFGTETL